MTGCEQIRADDTAHLISAIRREVNRFLAERMEQAGLAGLAPSHGDIIASLLHHGPMTMSELAQRINRDPSTVTTLVRKLRDLGYVRSQRAQEDTRVRVVGLSEKGRELEQRFVDISNELVSALWRDVSESDRAITRCVLRRILRNVSIVD